MSITTDAYPASFAEPGFTETELGAWRGLLRAHAALVKRLDADLESISGLPLTSLEVLRTLGEAPGGRMRMCDLACAVMLSRSGLSRLVDRLERDGLLCRLSCEQDARGAYAALTDAGRGRLAATDEAYQTSVRAHFLAHFSDEEQAMLGAFWQRVAPATTAPCGCD